MMSCGEYSTQRTPRTQRLKPCDDARLKASHSNALGVSSRGLEKELGCHRRDDPDRPGAFEQQVHSAAALLAEIDGVLVHVQVDVPVHDLFAHLLGMFADVWQAGVPVRKGVLHAS